MEFYRSPFEADPRLAAEPEDLRVEFELLCDELATLTGVLAGQAVGYRAQLLEVAQMLVDAESTLRTQGRITPARLGWLHEQQQELADLAGHRRPVLPQGSVAAGTAHLARVRAKAMVRLLYRCVRQGTEVPPPLIDFANLLIGYYYYMAMALNRMNGVSEIEAPGGRF